MLRGVAPMPKPGAIQRARNLRRRMSLPEVLLWQSLRKRPRGLKFRRQHQTGACVLDFYCLDARLAIEVDGMVHDNAEQAEHDGRRDAWLVSHGIETRRIAASDVLTNAAETAEATGRMPNPIFPHLAGVRTEKRKFPSVTRLPARATSPSQARGGSMQHNPPRACSGRGTIRRMVEGWPPACSGRGTIRRMEGRLPSSGIGKAETNDAFVIPRFILHSREFRKMQDKTSDFS